MTSVDRLRTDTPEPAKGETPRYDAELSRSLKVLGNIAIVVAAITPASSAFVIAAVVFSITGSGASLAFLVAAVLGTAMAFCWAEMGAAYPLAGGDYSFISRTLGRGAGFVSLVLTGPIQAILIPAVIALGMAEYLGVAFHGDPNIVGAVVIAASTGIAIFGIRFSAFATGILLALELIAVALVTVLGFVRVERPVTDLFHPEIFGAGGASTPLTFGALLAGVAVASFAYNGFQGAILFSEETQGPAKNVARAVFWALGVAVAAELLPVTAALLGAPSMGDLTTSSAPWQYFLTSIGGETFNTVISLGIAIAILNGVIALMPYFARILYSSGRDNAWPAPVSKALATIHPRYKTPWVATVAIGAVGTVLILVTDVVTLSTWVGATVCVEYTLVAIAAIVSRLTKKDLERPYRMPLWPLAPVLGATIALAVLSQQTSRDLLVATGVIGLSLAYYAIYLRPRQATHMLMLAPPQPDADTAG